MNVREAICSTCSTGAVEGLSRQIIAAALARDPNLFVLVKHPRIHPVYPWVYLYLQPYATASVLRVIARRPGAVLRVISCLRVIPGQLMLWQHYLADHRPAEAMPGAKRGCGVPLAAPPGGEHASFHTRAAALDVESEADWAWAFKMEGWRHLAPSDPAHFDRAGGREDVDDLLVAAYQRLHNAHVTDGVLLTVDGQYGKATERALLEAPAAGYAGGGEAVPEKIGIVINGTQQQEVIDARLMDVGDGRGPGAYMRVSDWQKYAKCPPPDWNTVTRDVEFVTAKVQP